MPNRSAVVVGGIHSPGFDLLLIAHVASALFGFGALAATGVQAARLARVGSGEIAPGLRRFFAPGVNWAGRLLYAVPVLGLALVADSGGRFGFGDGWVLAGLALWVAAATAAEGVVWPAERRIQQALAPSTNGAPRPPASLARDCVLAAAGAAALAVLFVVSTVVMVARP